MSLGDVSVAFTEAVLDDIVRKGGGTKHTGYKFAAESCGKKGDSYLSKVFRLCVHGVNEESGAKQEINLIVKAMPENAARRRLFRSSDFFRNEVNFYKHIVPTWEDFQSRRKPKNPFVEYPICYASYCDGENDFIALEDVSFAGFREPNRSDYISLDECLLTMRSIGRFHGISLALRALEPDTFEKASKHLEETYYAEKYRSWYGDFQMLACSVAKDAIAKTFPGSKYETVADRFLQESLYSDLVALVSTKSAYSVICQGDCWVPNFLTRYTTHGSPEAIRIIDFQLARCASLALDISFFIYSCTSQQMREAHYERLLKEYHQSAADLITDLGGDAAKVLPWPDVLAELQRFGRFGCGMGIESLPMSLLEEDEVADLDDIGDNSVLTDVWNIKPFKEPAKRQRIADVFKHAIDQGYIV